MCTAAPFSTTVRNSVARPPPATLNALNTAQDPHAILVHPTAQVATATHLYCKPPRRPAPRAGHTLTDAESRKNGPGRPVAVQSTAESRTQYTWHSSTQTPHNAQAANPRKRHLVVFRPKPRFQLIEPPVVEGASPVLTIGKPPQLVRVAAHLVEEARLHVEDVRGRVPSCATAGGVISFT